MTIRSLALVATLLALVAGCHIGPQVSEVPALRLPQGATVQVVVKEADSRRRFRYEGELIELNDDGVLFELARDDGKNLYIAPWAEVDTLKATELEGFFSRSLSRPEQRAEKIGDFRLISRFPQGLSVELRSRLLAAYGQDAAL